MRTERLPVLVQQYEGQDALHWLTSTGDAPARLVASCKPESYSTALRTSGVALRSARPIKFLCPRCQQLYDNWLSSWETLALWYPNDEE